MRLNDIKNTISKGLKFFKEKGVEIFVMLVFILFIISFFQGAGKILFRIIVASIFAMLTYVSAGDKIKEAFRYIGLEKYTRVLFLIMMITIGLWNWLALLGLMMFFLVWYLIK